MIDISTYTNKIANERMVNAVRKAVYDAIGVIVDESWLPTTTQFDNALDNICEAVYGPDVRLAILSCIGYLLNWSNVAESEVAEDLNALATQRYGRALREPIIRLLKKAASSIQFMHFDLLDHTQTLLVNGYINSETGLIITTGAEAFLTTGAGLTVNPHTEDYSATVAFAFDTAPVSYGQFKYAGYKGNKLTGHYGYPTLSSEWYDADMTHDIVLPANDETIYYKFMFRKSPNEEAISESDLVAAEVTLNAD